jgi:hypothetical protein
MSTPIFQYQASPPEKEMVEPPDPDMPEDENDQKQRQQQQQEELLREIDPRE